MAVIERTASSVVLELASFARYRTKNLYLAHVLEALLRFASQSSELAARLLHAPWRGFLLYVVVFQVCESICI